MILDVIKDNLNLENDFEGITKNMKLVSSTIYIFDRFKLEF
jgi:hypothetical protein